MRKRPQFLTPTHQKCHTDYHKSASGLQTVFITSMMVVIFLGVCCCDPVLLHHAQTDKINIHAAGAVNVQASNTFI